MSSPCDLKFNSQILGTSSQLYQAFHLNLLTNRVAFCFARFSIQFTVLELDLTRTPILRILTNSNLAKYQELAVLLKVLGVKHSNSQ